MSRRGEIDVTPTNRVLVEMVTGKPEMRGPRARRLVVMDGVLHRPNGRFIVGNVPVIGDDGEIQIMRDTGGVRRVVTKRHRFRIPKGHPWRGTTPR